MGGPLLEVIESLYPLASRVVGQDAQIINIQPRTVPSAAVKLGLYPIVTLEKQLLNMTGNLV